MATKKSELSKDKIVSMYMDYVLEHNEKPKSVFKFSKINAICTGTLFSHIVFKIVT